MREHIVDVRDEVDRALANEVEVLLGVRLVQLRAGDHLGSAAVKLGRANRADDDGAAGREARVEALDVEELLAAHIGAEACLGEHVAPGAHQLEREQVGDDRRVAVRNVGERPAVHERRRALERLHRGGHQRVGEQHRQRAGDPKVVRSERRAFRVEGGDHAAEARAEVGHVGRQGEHRHDFGRDCDGEASLAVELLAGLVALGRREANVDLAKESVVGVGHALPCDGGFVDVEAAEGLFLLLREGGRVARRDAELAQPRLHRRLELALARLVSRAELVEDEVGARRLLVVAARVDRGGEEVVGRRDGVDVARHVQVELLHRSAL
mmetsp:Transcript_33345/g.91252  ORF Transcript_33345/g.91252 Transcript_33345/m.91252 type:complete len:325 (+) Transcript_33345:1131-2105(+)